MFVVAFLPGGIMELPLIGIRALLNRGETNHEPAQRDQRQ